MDFIKDNIRSLYWKLLLPSMTGAIVISIYSFVDTIAVGQSEGVIGTGAMAVMRPVYGVMIFLDILCGIGGSVLMSIARGEGKQNKADACFTVSIVLMILLGFLFWIVLLVFRNPVLRLFGATDDVMAKAIEYAKWVIWFMPVFIYMGFIGAFIRNDGAPQLVMSAVVIGGCVNMFGDWLLVFPMKMGMAGAALATVTGTLVQDLILSSYFFQKRCQLRLVRPRHFLKGFGGILSVGFGAGILDMGAVVTGTVMNNQIQRYAGTTELAIYGVLATIMGLFQSIFGGVGQAIQPLVSSNFGAKKPERIKTVWRMSLVTVIVLGILFTFICEMFPVIITKLFMHATPEAVAAAPNAFRLFSIVFLPLGITVLTDYFLQSVLQEKASLLIGMMHSVILSSILCMVMPVFAGANGLWLALPIAEMIISACGLYFVYAKANVQMRML